MKKFNYIKWITESKHGKSLNEAFDANKIKDDLKNLTTQKDLPGFGPTTMVDDNVRSTLVGITLPSLEKTNAPEELVKNLKILSNDFDTKDGVPYSRQPEEVQNAIKYLTGDEAQESVDQIGDIEGGHASALKKGADTLGGSTEKIYTATAFPDGLKDSDWYKKAVEDGWKFIPKNSLTSDQEKIAKSLPTKSDGTPLEEELRKIIREQIKNEMYSEVDSEPDYEWEKGSKAGPGNPAYDAAREKAKQDTRFTIDGKPVDTSSIEMSGMRPEWGPDDGSTDAYIEYATFIDGTELSDDQIERFQDEHPDLTQEEEWQKHFKLEELATKLGYLKEGVSKHLQMYSLLNDLRDEGHLHRYGVAQLQLQFGLSEKEAQEIYNEYIEDLKAEQPDAADFYLKTLNKND